MVEQDAVAREQAVRLAVVHGDPVGVQLGHRVRRTRVERRGLALRGFLHQPVQLGRAGLVETRFLFQTEDADGFEQPQRAERVRVGRVFRFLERHRHVALRGEVVDLLRAHLLEHPDKAGRVGHVAVVQNQPPLRVVWVLVEVIDAIGVEQGGPPLDAVHLVTLAQQELGEIGAVLAGDARDQRLARHVGTQVKNRKGKGRRFLHAIMTPCAMPGRPRTGARTVAMRA